MPAIPRSSTARRRRAPHGAPPCAAPRATVPRDALVAALAEPATARVRVVTGPAGSGKTVLLRQLATAIAGGRAVTDGRAGAVAWLPITATTAASADAFVRDAARVLDGVRADPGGVRTVLVDDAHRLAGSPAATAFADLVDAAPRDVRLVVATRHADTPWLTGVRSDVTVHHVGDDELRFRPWDVERLFRDVYRTPLAPEAAAALCARVEGLPIALKLLHLDTILLPAAEREVALRSPLAASPRLRAFLTDEVLAPLPADVRELLVDASALGVLDGALVDDVLGRTGSGAVLERLAATGGFTARTDTGHRFHALLQELLERRLAERLGPRLTRQAYARAASRLAVEGHWAEAYRAHARTGDWVSAAAVLHHVGARRDALLASATVPPSLLRDDPWIALAEARRLRGEGRLPEAYDLYVAAEDGLPDQRSRWQCAVERTAIARWIPGDDRDADPLVDDVSAHIADAVRGHPAKLLTRPVPAVGPAWGLGRALAAMLDGRTDLAIELAGGLTSCDDVFASLAGRILAAGLEAAAHARGTVATFGGLAAEAEASGWLWLARVARAATALVDAECCADATAVLEQCRDAGDDWGALVTGFLLGMGLVRAGRPADAVLRDTAALAARLGARVPELWLRALLGDDIDPGTVADVRVDRVVTHRADLVAALTTPLRARLTSVPAPRATPPAAPPVAVRCFGRYELLVDGRDVDLATLRAQPRRVLRVLSIHCGQPLHEERLVTALWPDASLKQAKHRLQVAISSLRAALRPHLPAGGEHGIVRHGSAYLLRLPPGSAVDVVEFAETLRQWRAARSAGERHVLLAAGRRVLDLHRGELLAEEGPAEWVVARREALRGEAAGVACALARLLLDDGDAPGAIEVCEQALRVDELDNRLWALLAEARRRCGNDAAATRTAQTYSRLLAEG